MFFWKDYTTPGPGIRPDEPEKTGWKRFAEILTLECVTLVKLNLLFLLSSIPVVTLPIALYAMHMVVRRMVRDEPVDCFYHYRRAAREHWKTAYAAFFAVGVPLAASAYGMATYLRFAAGNPVFFLPFMFCSTVFLITVLSSACFYTLLSMGKPVRQALRLAAVLGVGRPLRTLPAALCAYGLAVLAVLAFPLSVPYWLLIGFSVPCLLANFFVRTIVKPYSGP